MTNKYWLFCLIVLSIVSFASITASNEFVTAPQFGAASHSANNQPQWVPSNAAASSSAAVASGDDHSHSSPSSLTAHHGRKQSLNEDPSKTFVCTLCSHRFRRQEHLKRHYHSLHTHDKPFECTDCGKKFSRSDNVNQYQCTHGACTVVMGVLASDSGIYTTWWIALVVISVVMFIHRINQSRQRVNNIAQQRSALKLYLRDNYEVKDDPYDSTSSDELDHINDQDSNTFVPAIYRDQTIRNRTGQTSITAAATRAIQAPAPRRQLAATFL